LRSFGSNTPPLGAKIEFSFAKLFSKASKIPRLLAAGIFLLQTAILAYNTLRWMALCSGNKILQRWEAATIRTFLIRMAGKWTTGSRQQILRVPKRMLYNAQWEAWVAVAET